MTQANASNWGVSGLRVAATFCSNRVPRPSFWGARSQVRNHKNNPPNMTTLPVDSALPTPCPYSQREISQHAVTQLQAAAGARHRKTHRSIAAVGSLASLPESSRDVRKRITIIPAAAHDQASAGPRSSELKAYGCSPVGN